MDLDLKHNLRFKDSVGKFVKVKTVDSREHNGWLKCIDPMTGNMFLITLNSDLSSVCETILITGRGCTSLDVIREGNDEIKAALERLYRSETLHHENVTERKQSLIAWFKKNRLPVIEKENECIEVCDDVTISPPYNVQDCSSLNGRVLKNIRQLVITMPVNKDDVAVCETQEEQS